MRKLHYKGRCTRRKLSKCKDICRTYDKVQTVYADWLQANKDIVSFECNIKMEGVCDDQYTSDFLAVKSGHKDCQRMCLAQKPE